MDACRAAFNYITSALLRRHQVFSSWYHRHLTQSLCSQAEPIFFPFLLPSVLKIEARHPYYLLGVGLHEMANKTDNILYWICNCKASRRWHFPSLSVSRTWWRSHYPADCSPMLSQLWRELMWAFSYIWFPLEETVTRGDWAEQPSGWVNQTAEMTGKQFTSNSAAPFTKQVPPKHLPSTVKAFLQARQVDCI